MKLICLYFFILLAFTGLNFQSLCKKLEFFSQTLQSVCRNQFSPQQQSKNLSAAFVCGTDIVDFEQQKAFQATGLIHLIVVSGSHLKMISLVLVNFLSLLLLHKKHRAWILFPLLFAYCLVTGFQAPAIRAFVLLALIQVSQHFCLNWNQNLATLFSGLILAFIFPHWVFNFSFYLSWLASLGFCFPFKFNMRRLPASVFNFFFSSFLIQFFMGFLLQSFALLSLLTNLLLAPLLSFILWPISLAPLISDKLIPVSDFCWSGIVEILNKITIQFSMARPLDFSDFDWFKAWLFVAFLHSLFHYLHQKRRHAC